MEKWTTLSSLDGVWGILAAAIFLLLVATTAWRIFRKAHRPGWAALVPIYNAYVLTRIAAKPWWFFLLYLVPGVNIVAHILVSVSLARTFQKGRAFGFFLLWLLPFIGYPVLAFGNALYIKNGRPFKHYKSLKPAPRRIIIVLLAIFTLISAMTVMGWAYYRYQQQRVRDEVTQETTKFQNVSFDTLDEWNDQYRMTVMYPKTNQPVIDAAAKAKVNTYVDQFRALVAKKPAGSKPYTLHIVGTVNLATKNVINFLYDGSWSINGQTGNITVNALFNRQTGKEVQTKDLFKGNGYLTIASDAARKELPGILGAHYSKALVDKGTTPVVANFDQFQLVDSKSVDIIFEPGQVADVSLGVIKVSLSLDSLQDQWNQDEVSALFPDFITALKAKEAADAAAAKKAADEAAAAAAAAAAASAQKQSGNYLPAHGDVDCTKAKCIALSFDDGPGDGTDTILDTLQKYNAHATFMVVGLQVASHTEQLKRELALGNDIGNHTWDHSDLTSLSPAGVLSEVNRTGQAVANVLGGQPFMVRPPYGAYNQTVLNTLKMPLVLWSVDPDDWKDRDADIVYQRVMSHAHPGAIILSHDLYPTTAAAYQRIIPDLINQGYTLVTVSNLEGIDPANLTPDVYFGKY